MEEKDIVGTYKLKIEAETKQLEAENEKIKEELIRSYHEQVQ